MSNTNDSFENDLEQLIRLFKKIKDKTKAEQFSHLDPAFAQNLDFIISNYEMVKNNIPKDMFTQMGLPFQQMMKEFISHLKTELGDEFEDEELHEEDDLTDAVTEPMQKVDSHKLNLSDEVRKIDELLKKPGLSEEKINKLLDRRSMILNG
jgi:hypothetical protein